MWQVTLYGQEYEIGLTSNSRLGGRVFLKNALIDTISLPFFDDFSGTDPYPNPKYWIDNNVFINSTYEFEPVSTGVATFDALDETGNVYDIRSKVFGADTLTSKPIDLSGKEDVYLSFFYQPQGLGNKPESHDSLKLQFKQANDSVWDTQFLIEGMPLKPFEQVILPVGGSYLFKGFQFRFINIVSLSTENIIGLGANADHWNIDYVYLNEKRSLDDTTYSDVTFTTPVPGILDNYQSLPWKHFSLAKNNELASYLPLRVKNYNNNTLQVDIGYFIQDKNFPELQDVSNYFPFNLGAKEDTLVKGDLAFEFLSSPSVNRAEFYIRSSLKDISENLNNRVNDTIEKYIAFNDYYAFDDGSPEAGYGVKGIGSEDAQFAMKFYTYKRDTLKNIYMFFNPTNDSLHNTIKFKLTVWNSVDNQPGQEIWEKTAYVNSLSKEFEKYSIDDELVIEGEFFIGWQQLEESYLNLGLDKNNINNGFINTNGNWLESTIQGTVMIRAGFGTPVINSANREELKNINWSIYPNPATDYININLDNYHFDNIYTIEILDLYGRTLQKEEIRGTKRVDVSLLKTGLYMVILKDGKHIIAKQKLLVH